MMDVSCRRSACRVCRGFEKENKRTHLVSGLEQLVLLRRQKHTTSLSVVKHHVSDTRERKAQRKRRVLNLHQMVASRGPWGIFTEDLQPLL